MLIRRAKLTDKERINSLLFQVANVHANGRPDIFKAGSKKYTDSELGEIISNDSTPIFVAEDENGYVCGYAFCIFEEVKENNLLCDMRSLYIDDLCVDEKMRGNHIGSSLYEYVLDFARSSGAYRVTLNVWNFNESAKSFYEKKGLSPLKTVMEYIF